MLQFGPRLNRQCHRGDLFRLHHVEQSGGFNNMFTGTLSSAETKDEGEQHLYTGSLGFFHARQRLLRRHPLLDPFKNYGIT